MSRSRLWVGRISSKSVAWRLPFFGAVALGGLAVQLGAVGLFHRHLGLHYTLALGFAVLVAMTFNFVVHNVLTFADRRLRGLAQIKGWLSFCFASAFGGLLNMGVASIFFALGWHWALSALMGAAAGGLVNYALASRYTWKPSER